MKLVWVFLEPAGQLIILIIVFSLIGRTPDYGRSFALFLLTGISMLSVYRLCASAVASSVIGLASTTRLPQVGLFHDAVAKLCFSLITMAISTAIIAAFVGWYDQVSVIPVDWPLVVAAFWVTGIAGFGMGLILGWCKQFFQPIDRIYGIISRALLFISGVFYVPSFMPPEIRDGLVWNPMIHSVELMRLGIYGPRYPTIVYSPDYFMAFAFGTTAFGMLLLWLDGRRVIG